MKNIISIFNNKGGVGKTTYMYHVAHLLAKNGHKVLMVDCDSQCNLTAYSLSDTKIEQAWGARGKSIFKVVEPVYKGIGDFRKRQPSPAGGSAPNLFLVPGDLSLSNYEDALGDSWTGAKGGNEPNIRVQSAIYRYISWAIEKINADVTFVDLGPNLGAINRTMLGASDYFIVPVSPDLFSIRGTENLGNKLVLWRKEWDQLNEAWKKEDIEIPNGKPIFLGYVFQQHNVRNNPQGMTKGWATFGKKLEPAIKANIVDKLKPLDQVQEWHDGSWLLGQIPNLHSLIPYSLNARKPVFDCTQADGLTGAHIQRARDSAEHYDDIVATIESVIS